VWRRPEGRSATDGDNTLGVLFVKAWFWKAKIHLKIFSKTLLFSLNDV
jgi:hypothetical protein